MVMEMQHTYEEQQSNVDEMIRQVALLAVMIKEIQEDKARYEVKEKEVKEEGVIEAEEKELAGGEQKSEVLWEQTKADEVESVGKETLTEEKSIPTPPEDGTQKEFLEETHDEPQEEEEEVSNRDVELDYTLFYPQSEEAHMPNEKVEEFITTVNGENAPAERPP